tara:strand:- start:14437 stop:15489 length:1053 start_codon:yes stop_codon:yes gene_type:complete
MDSDSINDVRTDFKNITFSSYQKSQARKELISCIYNEKVENANYWAAEFVCSGHYLELWDAIILYSTKYVHCGNPKLPIYLNMRFDNFEKIINSGYSNNVIVSRNNLNIRKIFAELICVLCFSQKKHNYEQIKLNKLQEFDLHNISGKFKAPNVTYIQNIYKDDDPKELYIPINELIYNITTKNVIECCYWYEWIIEYENICKKKKKKCICEARMYAPKGYHNDIVWIIWDIIFFYSKNIQTDNQNYTIINKIINSLYNLFTIKYKPTFKSKRKYIIYYSFSILIDKIDYNINIINNDSKIEKIIEKINTIYREIKKNEESPNTDYLYKDIAKSNIEKTFEKLEIMKNIL